jgi:hypothetical protein
MEKDAYGNFITMYTEVKSPNPSFSVPQSLNKVIITVRISKKYGDNKTMPIAFGLSEISDFCK